MYGKNNNAGEGASKIMSEMREHGPARDEGYLDKMVSHIQSETANPIEFGSAVCCLVEMSVAALDKEIERQQCQLKDLSENIKQTIFQRDRLRQAMKPMG